MPFLGLGNILAVVLYYWIFMLRIDLGITECMERNLLSTQSIIEVHRTMGRSVAY